MARLTAGQRYEPWRMIVVRQPSGLLIGHHADFPGFIIMERTLRELHTQASELWPIFRAALKDKDTSNE